MSGPAASNRTERAPGETDLVTLLGSLDVQRLPGTYGYIETVPGDPTPTKALAMVTEGRTVAWVVPLPHPGAVFPSAWLSLTLNSSLEAVGLTAAFAAALADRGIPANVLAGLRRDHLLVPVEQVDDAIAALRALASDSRAGRNGPPG